MKRITTILPIAISIGLVVTVIAATCFLLLLGQFALAPFPGRPKPFFMHAEFRYLQGTSIVLANSIGSLVVSLLSIKREVLGAVGLSAVVVIFFVGCVLFKEHPARLDAIEALTLAALIPCSWCVARLVMQNRAAT